MSFFLNPNDVLSVLDQYKLTVPEIQQRMKDANGKQPHFFQVGIALYRLSRKHKIESFWDSENLRTVHGVKR
jgi:hypothetical protein